MKKMFVLPGLMLLFVLIASACAAPAQPTQPPAQVIPATQVIAPTEVPTQVPPTAVPATDVPAATLAPTVAAAPLQPIVVTENDRFCEKKIPYTLIGMPEASTYQMVTAGFSCTEGGVQKGQHLITCTGPMYSLFKINVCEGGACQDFEFGTTNCP